VSSEKPHTREAGVLLGREFITAVVMFHESVGRLLGLTAVERKCLDVLDRCGPMTAGAISENTGLTTGAVTGLIDRLRGRGFVSREADPKDGRRVLVSLLPHPASEELRASVFGPLGADMQALTDTYTPEQLATIADFLQRTTDVLVENTSRVGAMQPAVPS
jgi:DNA-binding MarR family transcriptional regulator